MKLRFRYVNHRRDEHEYTIEPNGLSRKDGKWCITGLCLERDGKSRHANASGFPIRSFVLAGMRDIEEVQ